MVRRTPNSQEGIKSVESNAKNQECANQSGRRRACRDAPSGHDGAKNPESCKWPGGHRVVWNVKKSRESAETSAWGGAQTARTVSISEESADQPGESDQPGTQRSLMVSGHRVGGRVSNSCTSTIVLF